MWYLLTFEKQGDKLIKSQELPSLDLAAVRSIWNGSDAELVGLSWPVDDRKAQLLAPYVSSPLELDQFDYFVDFFRDDSPAPDLRKGSG